MDNFKDDPEKIGKIIVNSAFKVHKALGPGLLEKVYESCLEYELKKQGLMVERQLPFSVEYDGLKFDEGFRLDLYIERRIIIELKAVEQFHPVWEAQIMSYMKLLKCNLGYLINFNVPLIKQGIRRFKF